MGYPKITAVTQHPTATLRGTAPARCHRAPLLPRALLLLLPPHLGLLGSCWFCPGQGGLCGVRGGGERKQTKGR